MAWERGKRVYKESRVSGGYIKGDQPVVYYMLTLWMGGQTVCKWRGYAALNGTNDSVDLFKNFVIGVREPRDKLFLNNFGILQCGSSK